MPEIESIIVGVILLVFGGLNVIQPDILMRFQVWSQCVIMGARYEPSARTYRITRVIGAALVVLGLLAVTGVIE